MCFPLSLFRFSEKGEGGGSIGITCLSVFLYSLFRHLLALFALFLPVNFFVCLSCSTLLRFPTKEGPHLFLFLSLSVSLPACLSQTHGSFVVAHVPFHFLSGSIYSFPLLPKTPVNT